MPSHNSEFSENEEALSIDIVQLQDKLTSSDVNERLAAVSFIGRTFYERRCSLANLYPHLWQVYVRRFHDINVAIRCQCVRDSVHFLTNYPSEIVKAGILKALKDSQCDPEENVRLKLVKAIIAVAKSDFSLVFDNESLLNCLRDRIRDKKVNVRQKALKEIAKIYQERITVGYPDELTTMPDISWINEKMLHAYCSLTLDDKILIEQLFKTRLVPYLLEPKERMCRLLYLYGTIGETASKAVTEIFKSNLLIRRDVGSLLRCINSADNDEHHHYQLQTKITMLENYMSKGPKVTQLLYKLCGDLKEDRSLMMLMEELVNPLTSCESSLTTMNEILGKLGSPTRTNTYFQTIQGLIQRVGSILIDNVAVKELILLLVDISNNVEGALDRVGLVRQVAINRGIILISVLAFAFPTTFFDCTTLKNLLQLKEHVGDDLIPVILKSLTIIGKSKPLIRINPTLVEDLVPWLKTLIVDTHENVKIVKVAVHCLYSNINETERDQIFLPILEDLGSFLNDPSNKNYRTSIVAVGHIALLMPVEFRQKLKPIISKNIVNDLIAAPNMTDKLIDKEDKAEWCDVEELPELTKCILEGLKALSRWLIGLGTAAKFAHKAFALLTSIMRGEGLTNSEDIILHYSIKEMSWLRFSAGCCMLKICEYKGVGDEFSSSQLIELSNLMTDEVFELRSRFHFKLHKGLTRLFPQRCLPLEFTGLYALGGFEEDANQRKLLQTYLRSAIDKRHQYAQVMLSPSSKLRVEQLQSVLPNFIIVYAIPILANSRKFTNFQDIDQLNKIKACLWFMLEPLIKKNPDYVYGFYSDVLAQLKNCRTLPINDDSVNNKMYAICDLALGLIQQQSSIFKLNYPSDQRLRIPRKYFEKNTNPSFTNQQIFLPPSMQMQMITDGTKSQFGKLPKRVLTSGEKIEIEAKKRK